MLFIKKNVYESHFSKLSPSPRFSHVFHNQYILNTENKNSPSLSAEEDKIFVDFFYDSINNKKGAATRRIFFDCIWDELNEYFALKNLMEKYLFRYSKTGTILHSVEYYSMSPNGEIICTKFLKLRGVNKRKLCHLPFWYCRPMDTLENGKTVSILSMVEFQIKVNNVNRNRQE